MDLTSAHAIALIAIFLVPVVLGSLSVYLYNKFCIALQSTSKGQAFLSYVNCFSGGFFLGTCLLVMLGQGLEKFEEYRHTVQFLYKFPFIEVGIGVGFFLVALVEKLTHLALGTHNHGLQTDQEMVGILNLSPRSSSSTLKMTKEDVYEIPEHLQTTSTKPTKSMSQKYQSFQDENDRGTGTLVSSKHVPNTNQDTAGLLREFTLAETKPDADKNNSAAAFCGSDETKNNSGKSQSDQDCQSHAASCNLATLRVVLLLLALSFHSLFDGMAIGLQEKVSTVITLLVLFILHKAVIALVLGVELATVFIKVAHSHHGCLLSFLALLLFSMASPIGVAIGMGVTSGHVSRPAQLLAGTLLQSVATGVFLYVTCFELLVRDMVLKQDRPAIRVLVAISGFSLIAIIQTVHNH